MRGCVDMCSPLCSRVGTARSGASGIEVWRLQCLPEETDTDERTPFPQSGLAGVPDVGV